MPEASKTHNARGGEPELAAARDTLIHSHLIQADDPRAGALFEREHARLVDTFLQHRMCGLLDLDVDAQGLEQACTATCGFALAAVGGYGRGELSLHSDIDLLILCRDALPPDALDLAQPLFLPLWDMGYVLGHGFRSIPENLELAYKDFQVLTSLLDLRHIAGDPSITTELSAKLRARLTGRRRAAYLKWLARGAAQRFEQHGDGSALLEPSLKDGVGGLRDYHNMLWLARVTAKSAFGAYDPTPYTHPDLTAFLDPLEARDLSRHLAMLCRTRNMLHAVSKRKNDKLHLEIQPEVARRMGFADADTAMAVEHFLSALHRAMAGIKTLRAASWRLHADPILDPAKAARGPRPVAPGILLDQDLRFASGCEPETDPDLLMRLFVQAAEHEAQLAPEAARTVTSHLPLVRERLAGKPEAWARFTDILYSGHAAPVLEAMLETGFLGAFIPEMAAVQDRVQFDEFHQYPVGRHSIRTVDWLERLDRSDDKQDAPFALLWSEETDRRALLLAALFHDLGKADGVAGHEDRGADSVADMLMQLGVEPDVVDDVRFLVRRHLFLASSATRRDLADEGTAVHCAATARTARRWDMLYLLTYADSRATGPKAWSDWSSRLMAECYVKVRRLLTEGFMAAPMAADQMEATLESVRELAAERHAQEFLDQALNAMPGRYTLAMRPDEIVRHLDLVAEFQKLLAEASLRVPGERGWAGLITLHAEPDMQKGADTGQAEQEEQTAIWRLSVVARRHHGLFATLAGVLALHDINIFGADLFAWSDGTVVDVFRVSSPPDPLYAQEFWGRVRSAVRYALTGKLDVRYHLTEKRASPMTRTPKLPQAPVEVIVDNETSDFDTIVEVRARDRLGLLYEIADTLTGLDLTIRLAKAATHADRIVDVFYVRDELGAKALRPDLVDVLREELGHRLA